jgi:hypothetical protein
MTDRYIKHPALLTFGKGGHQIYYRGEHRSTLSGYSRPDDPTVASDLPDGLPVINKRAVMDNADAIRLLISGPMVAVNLDDGAVSYLSDTLNSIVAQTVKADRGNSMGGLVRLQEEHRASTATTPGPLDEVSVPAYIELWRQVGAPIGAVKDGLIIWDKEAK